jgi:hypothetical protein
MKAQPRKVIKCECGLLKFLRKMPTGPRYVHIGAHRQMHDSIMAARARKAAAVAGSA